MTDPTPPGMPRWVKVFLIVAVVLLLLVVVALMSGRGGRHGPRRHLPEGMDGGPGVAAIRSS